MADYRYGLIHYNAPGETLEAFLDYAAEAGFDGVELQARDVWREDEADAQPEREAERVRRLAEDRGLFIGALAAGNNFLVSGEAAVTKQVQRMERLCRLAKLLGTNIIRSEAGAATEAIPQSHWPDAMAVCFRRCVPFLEELEVYLGVDNHGTVSNDAVFQMQLLGMVGSKYVGTTMDTMNYRWMGHDLDTCNRFYELSAMRCVHLHLKDGTGSRGEYRGEALGEGEIDLAHAIRQLKRWGYSGLWCAEYEGRDADGYTRCLAWMKEHVPAVE